MGVSAGFCGCVCRKDVLRAGCAQSRVRAPHTCKENWIHKDKGSWDQTELGFFIDSLESGL